MLPRDFSELVEGFGLEVLRDPELFRNGVKRVVDFFGKYTIKPWGVMKYTERWHQFNEDFTFVTGHVLPILERKDENKLAERFGRKFLDDPQTSHECVRSLVRFFKNYEITHNEAFSDSWHSWDWDRFRNHLLLVKKNVLPKLDYYTWAQVQEIRLEVTHDPKKYFTNDVLPQLLENGYGWPYSIDEVSDDRPLKGYPYGNKWKLKVPIYDKFTPSGKQVYESHIVPQCGKCDGVRFWGWMRTYPYMDDDWYYRGHSTIVQDFCSICIESMEKMY